MGVSPRPVAQHAIDTRLHMPDGARQNLRRLDYASRSQNVSERIDERGCGLVAEREDRGENISLNFGFIQFQRHLRQQVAETAPPSDEFGAPVVAALALIHPRGFKLVDGPFQQPINEIEQRWRTACILQRRGYRHMSKHLWQKIPPQEILRLPPIGFVIVEHIAASTTRS